jgi:hypothetical protein
LFLPPLLGAIATATPDPKVFQLSEYNEGVKQQPRSLPVAGFENSLYYRKIMFSEVLAGQIPEHQLKTIKNFPIRRTWFNKHDCAAELDFHLAWRNASTEFPLINAKRDPNNPNDYIWWTVRDSPHYPKMCALYLQAVMNTPISIQDLNMSISLDDFERRKRKLRLVN